MKSLLLSIVLLTARVGWAQNAPTYQQLVKLVGVPGAVLVGDSLFMDDAEVANIHWLEYLHFLRQDSTEEKYQAAKPDTAVWGQLAFNDPYILYYFRYPGFRYFPVVGISYEQAVAYCRWRTIKVNQNLHQEAYLRKHPKLRNYDFWVEYRLPTVREWERAAAGGLDPVQYPLGMLPPSVPGDQHYRHSKVRRPAEAVPCLADKGFTYQPGAPVFRMPVNVREHYYVGNVRQAFDCKYLSESRGSLTDGAMITDYIYVNPPNAYGCYNMIGNVAELTATPGTAKGGSFSQSITEVAVQKTYGYTRPQMWLGFRCACTVHITAKR